MIEDDAERMSDLSFFFSIHLILIRTPMKSYHGHTESIKTCQLIENKNWLITGSNDNTARLWNINSGQEIQKYELNHTMAAVSAVRINQETTRYINSHNYITNQLIKFSF
jgi:WD40 repeat protein